jgi:hypothetical protein
MTRKTKKALRVAPTQKYVLRPIEDPAEQAALDERLNRCEKAMACDAATESTLRKPTAAMVVESCRELSSKGRLQVAAELMTLLSLEQHIALLERMTAQLPAPALRRLEEQLHERLRSVDDEGARNHETHRNKGA